MRTDFEGGIMYGYKIENGTIVVVEDEAAIIRSIFKNYLSGMSMQKAADATGVDFPHSTVKKIIRQKRYIGNGFYPAIIEKDVFARANGELLRRASKHCRGKRLKEPPIFTEFKMFVPKQQFSDPVQQAEYIYSLIEVKR